ncbi:hypothetical protein D3C78_1207800 [compost metagenome]
MPAAGLAPVADAEGEEFAAPVEIRPAEMPLGGVHLGKARQAGEQVGQAAEDLLQVLGRIGGDLRAEAAGRHVEEQPSLHLAHVHRTGRRIQQRQRRVGFQRDAGGAGEIVGRAQRQQRQAGRRPRLRQRLGHFAGGAVAAAGDQCRIPGSQRLADDPRGVAVLPGDPHGQFPAGLAPGLHRLAHLFVGRLLAVQHQHRLAFSHRSSPFSRCIHYGPSRAPGNSAPFRPDSR